MNVQRVLFIISERLFLRKLTALTIRTALFLLWLLSITWDVGNIIIQTFLNSDLGSITTCCGATSPSTPLSPSSCWSQKNIYYDKTILWYNFFVCFKHDYGMVSFGIKYWHNQIFTPISFFRSQRMHITI